MQCPQCGLNDVATNNDSTIKPHPRPDTLQLCTGPTQPTTPEPAQPERKPATKKAPAKAAKPRTKRQ